MWCGVKGWGWDSSRVETIHGKAERANCAGRVFAVRTQNNNPANPAMETVAATARGPLWDGLHEGAC